jgi:hypothetical protein
MGIFGVFHAASADVTDSKPSRQHRRGAEDKPDGAILVTHSSLHRQNITVDSVSEQMTAIHRVGDIEPATGRSASLPWRILRHWRRFIGPAKPLSVLAAITSLT